MFLPSRQHFSLDSMNEQIKRKRKLLQINKTNSNIPQEIFEHLNHIRIFHPKAFVSAPKRYNSLQPKQSSKQCVKKLKIDKQKYISQIFSQGRTQPLCIKLPPILKNINLIQPIVSQKCLVFMSELSSISFHQLKSPKKKREIVIIEHQKPLSQQQIKILKNKQYRKNKIIKSKKVLNQQQLFTKQGWKHDTRGHWLSKFATNK